MPLSEPRVPETPPGTQLLVERANQGATVGSYFGDALGRSIETAMTSVISEARRSYDITDPERDRVMSAMRSAVAQFQEQLRRELPRMSARPISEARTNGAAGSAMAVGDFEQQLVEAFERRGLSHEAAVLAARGRP